MQFIEEKRMDRRIQEKAKRFAAKCDAMEFCSTCCSCSVAEVKKRSRRRDYGLLLALCGVMVCNQFGLGLGQAVCHGLMSAFVCDLKRHPFNNQTMSPIT